MDEQREPHEFSIYLLELVDLGIKMSEGTITREEAVSEYNRIRELTSYKMLPQDPLLFSRRDYFHQIRRNFQFLLKHNIRNPGLYYDAFDEWTRQDQQSLNSKLLPVLKHFEKFPLSTISHASKTLRLHYQTVSKRLKKLKEDYWLVVKGLTNNWIFGLRLFILLFNFDTNYTWETFFQSIGQYPFLNIANEDRLNGHHYLTFQLPNDRRTIDVFRRSVTKLANEQFSYWRLHEGFAAGFSKNMDLLNEEGWAYPQELVPNESPPELVSDFQPMIYRCKFDPLYDLIDFKVSDVLSSDCRLSSSSISTRTGLSTNVAYRRKEKLLSRGMVLPLTFWTEVNSGHIRIECDCSRNMKNTILASAFKLPEVAYYITTTGIVLWVDVPIVHIEKYTEYFNSMLDSKDVSSHRMVIGKTWLGSRPRSDITKDWKFGQRGFTIEGLDIDPDILDYV
ncbi:MAG: hypothetical protein ACFFDD_12710 [Promethearchaeota archaeon]